ncbi:HTH CENPB-type domain-containing protein, partial [Nephila pilipes]
SERELLPGSSSASDAEEFQTSKGWFDWFVKCYQLQIANSHEETAPEDTEVAEKYPETFKQLIEEKGFKPEQQVFYMNEAGLFCKKNTSKTFRMKNKMKAPGF